ncbi:MAG: thioesterase domain-containing protein [Verrucomicrobiales bacterium]|nr:thioesterase domain-containing protein [Verrucomicrobiales bacterium]
MHPSDGNVLCYVELAAAMGADYPFYGLQAKGLNGKDEPLREVATMAKHYIDAIRRVQAQGPYHLGGWSAGGLIAFEMAQQLMEMGESVNLVLLDSIYPARFPQESGISHEARLREILFGIESAELPENYEPAHTLRAIWDEAAAGYDAKPYPGKITLVLTESFAQRKEIYMARLKQRIAEKNFRRSAKLVRMLEGLDQLNPANWVDLAEGGFEMVPTSGDHHSFLYRENCQHVAQCIMRCIDSAD